MICVNFNWLNVCTLDRFTKRLLWNIIWSRPVSMEEYYAESMLENKFCSNVAPSLSSGTHFWGWVGTIWSHYETRPQLYNMVLVNLFSLVFTPLPLWQHPGPLRQHPDTLQTPQTHHRHPLNTPQTDSIRRHWRQQNKTTLNWLFQLFWILLHPDNMQDPSDNTQTPSRPHRQHPDTPRMPCRHSK